MGLNAWIQDTNLRVARSPVGRWFRLENSGHVSTILYYACGEYGI